MTHDPYPLLERIDKIIPSKESLGVDLDNPLVWSRPAIEDYQYLVVHWGGGPNDAGWPIEEPALTVAEKLAVQLGRCFRVVRSWMAYHKSKGMSTIAYSTGIDPLYGRILKFRGHRANGGQWGRINTITHAVVFIMGFGQKATRRAWEALGLVWFASGAPDVVGHRFFNDWPETQTKTACPGDMNTVLIAQSEYLSALGRLRWRLPRMSGRKVRAVTAKLADMKYLDGMKSRYTREVRDAVARFQADRHLTDNPGVVGASTWFALAEAP